MKPEARKINTTWSEEQKEKAITDICIMIEQGKSLKNIIDNSSRTDIPSWNQFYNWLRENESYREKYAHATNVRADKIFEEILEIADSQENDVIETNNGKVTNHNVINRNRLQIDARKWMLSKMNPKKYGDRVDVTSDGEKIQSVNNIVSLGSGVKPTE